jgi:Monomeric isocitrate dehydrogenase
VLFGSFIASQEETMRMTARLWLTSQCSVKVCAFKIVRATSTISYRGGASHSMKMMMKSSSSSSSSSSTVSFLSTTSTTTTTSDHINNNKPLWSSNHKHYPLLNAKGSVIYTETDEAPALATYSLYPVVSKVRTLLVLLLIAWCKRSFRSNHNAETLSSYLTDVSLSLTNKILFQFAALSDIDVIPCDISVAGRVLASFPEKLSETQYVPDNLGYLGSLAKHPDCSIVKLPNISAPINQLTECIGELRSKGYDVPLYPTEPSNDTEREIVQRYQSVMGSAVNPVLREGNSDRRVATAVKAYAQKNPHRMGLWSRASRSHVAHMTKGDFYANELSCIYKSKTNGSVRIELHPVAAAAAADTTAVQVLNANVPLVPDEVLDASYISIKALQDFYTTEIQDAKDNDILLSLHLKATMMKISGTYVCPILSFFVPSLISIPLLLYLLNHNVWLWFFLP